MPIPVIRYSMQIKSEKSVYISLVLCILQRFIMFPREMSKKDSFGKFLLNILKKTEFQGARMFNGSSKCLDQLNSFETSLELQPFVTWFTESITDENCVTNEELEM